MKKILLFLPLVILFACRQPLPIVDSYGENNFELMNQNGEKVFFPEAVKGKIAVVGYIFTNCPDICPLTTNNMRLIQQKLREEEIGNIEFVSISFDPGTDTPEVLRKFAGIRNLDLSNWMFLTGQKSITDSLIHRVGVFAVPSDSTVFSDGRKIYYYTHTDRIHLVDTNGKIRKEYQGSKINIEEITEDIKNLESE